jgi:hypothetical protein
MIQGLPGGPTGMFVGALAGVVLLLLLSPAIHGLSVTGVSIGIFMGVLAGIVLLLLLSHAITMIRKPIAAVKPIAAISKLIIQLTAAILSLPAIMFGGNWMSTTVLRVRDANFSDCYTLSLTLVFLLIIAYPVSKWVLDSGRSMGESTQSVTSSGRASP